MARKEAQKWCSSFPISLRQPVVQTDQNQKLFLVLRPPIWGTVCTGMRMNVHSVYCVQYPYASLLDVMIYFYFYFYFCLLYWIYSYVIWNIWILKAKIIFNELVVQGNMEENSHVDVTWMGNTKMRIASYILFNIFFLTHSLWFVKIYVDSTTLILGSIKWDIRSTQFNETHIDFKPS